MGLNFLKKQELKNIFSEKKQYFTVREPIYYLNGKTSLVVLPAPELYISYAVNYDHPDLTRRWAAYNPKNREEIIEARTFGFYKDLKKFQMLGFAQGVNIENTLGLQDEGYTSPLRSENEPVKHKILDLIRGLLSYGSKSFKFEMPNSCKRSRTCCSCKSSKNVKRKIN